METTAKIYFSITFIERKKGKEHAYIFFYELSVLTITVYPAKGIQVKINLTLPTLKFSLKWHYVYGVNDSAAHFSCRY